ncbi:hypothetical protein BSLG_010392 [Batrachochytrium salamandrivorans]|nr:hypothetical protein BSLG_010392 [Batrachochytrium salamandrivorans]
MPTSAIHPPAKKPVSAGPKSGSDLELLGSSSDTRQKDIFRFVPKDEQLTSAGSKHRVRDLDIENRGGSVPSRATLIVCPLSTISNWEEQIEMHAAVGSLSVHVYHGSTRSMDARRIAKFDVVITTYTILASSFTAIKKKKRAVDDNDGEDNDDDDDDDDRNNTRRPKRLIPPLHQIYWHRIVLDEAHIIKCSTTVQARAAFALQAQKRWCLSRIMTFSCLFWILHIVCSGTPIQNHMDDVYSLLRFLRMQPFNVMSNWRHYISRPIKQGTNSIGLSRLQTLMKAITLRRTKSQAIDGKPLLELPEKTERIVLLDFSPKERELYKSIHAKARALFSQLEAENSLLNNYVHILESILRMRQACTHPRLCSTKDADIAALLSPSEPPVLAQPCVNDSLDSYDDTPMRMSSNSDEVDAADKEKAPDRVIKYTAKDVRHMLLLYRESGDDRCVVCDRILDGIDRTIAIANCGHLFCGECVEGFQKTNDSTCIVCNSALSANDIQEFSGIGDIDDVDDDTPVDLTDLYTPIKLNVPMDDWLTYPTKVIALLDSLVELRTSGSSSDPPIKSVVFSQWTRMLDLLEVPLLAHGFQFTRLDGKMQRTARYEAMLKYKNDPNITVMLISLKSGGVGLNLTAASRVYLMEPYWNPAVEQQAVDRVHRMGQTRPVVSIRFIVKESIEENMLALQRKKLEMARMTFKETGKGYLDGDESDDAIDEIDIEEDGDAANRKRRRIDGDTTATKTKQRLERVADLRLLFQ